MKHIDVESGTKSAASADFLTKTRSEPAFPFAPARLEPSLSMTESRDSPMRRAGDRERTRIGLIDPYRFTQECLAKAFSLLNDHVAVRSFVVVKDCVSEAQSELDLLVYYSHDDGPSPEVILADLSTLRDAFPDVPLVVLSDATNAVDAETIRSMFHHGARGFIPTRFVGIPVAFAAIQFVQAGGKFAPLDFLLDGQPEPKPAPRAPEPPIGCLTARQRLVFSHLRQGKANKIIAYELGVSESTVKVHIKNIMRKIGATNRTQAVYKAQSIWSTDSTGRGVETERV